MDNHPALLLWHYIEQDDFDSARALLTDDFTFTNPTSDDVWTAEQWLGTHMMMNNASSDFALNPKNLQVDGDPVIVQLQFKGTHDGPLDLAVMGGPVIEATGKHFDTPYEDVHIYMDGDLIAQIEPQGNAPDHMMEQLGITMGG